MVWWKGDFLEIMIMFLSYELPDFSSHVLPTSPRFWFVSFQLYYSHLHWWCSNERLFCVVPTRQLWMDLRMQQSIWTLLCGFWKHSSASSPYKSAIEFSKVIANNRLINLHGWFEQTPVDSVHGLIAANIHMARSFKTDPRKMLLVCFLWSLKY